MARRGVVPFCAVLWFWCGELNCVFHVSLHTVTLSSSLVSGPVQVGVQDQLPVAGVDLILGNDLASVSYYSRDNKKSSC